MSRFIEQYNSTARPVELIDTTLRDGAQSPLLFDYRKHRFTTADKLQIAEGLIKYGVRHIEVFSPVVGGSHKRDIPLIVEKRDQLYEELGIGAAILAHVRVNEVDALRAIEQGVDGLNFYIGTSEESQQGNHGKSIDKIARISHDLISAIRRDHPHLLLRFSGEDAFRTDINQLMIVYDALYGDKDKRGERRLIDRFGTPDTVGIAEQEEVTERVLRLREEYPDIELEGHFHNDEELALYNAIAAIRAGMRYMQTSIGGLAERSGITNITSLIYKLRKYEKKGEVTYLRDYDLASSYALNTLLAEIIGHGMQVDPRSIISATNRTHSAGVHGGAMLNNVNTYEAHDLQEFGVEDSRLLLGPLSGWNVIKYYLENFLNYKDVTDQVARDITVAFKDVVEDKLGTGKSPTEILDQIAWVHDLRKRRLRRDAHAPVELVMGQPVLLLKDNKRV